MSTGVVVAGVSVSVSLKIHAIECPPSHAFLRSHTIQTAFGPIVLCLHVRVSCAFCFAHVVQLVGLDHADIRVEEIPADFVFPEPPKPWHLQPPVAAPTPAPGTPVLRVLSSATLAGSALLATAAWLVRCSRSRRRSFSHRVLQLSVKTDKALEEERSAEAARQGRSNSITSSVKSLSGSCGSLRDRIQEAERQLSTLEELIKDGVDIARRFPRAAARRAGEESRRFQACAQGLSRRLVKVEQAAEELRVMAEMEGLIARLDSAGSGGALNGGGGGAQEGEGSSGTAGGETGACGGATPARLSTRAAVLLSRRPSGGGRGSGDTSDSGEDNSTGYVPGCVFHEELKRWYDSLNGKEQDAVDWLEHGLKRWNLGKVDRALEQLRLLELPDIVEEFQRKRDDVRRKRRFLQEELKVGEKD